jgi:hypothetical protein
MRRGKYESSPFVTRVRELVPSLQTRPISSTGTDRPIMIKDLKEDIVWEGVYRCGWEVFRGHLITQKGVRYATTNMSHTHADSEKSVGVAGFFFVAPCSDLACKLDKRGMVSRYVQNRTVINESRHVQSLTAGVGAHKVSINAQRTQSLQI